VRVRVGYGGQGHMSAMAISGGEQVSADGGNKCLTCGQLVALLRAPALVGDSRVTSVLGQSAIARRVRELRALWRRDVALSPAPVHSRAHQLPSDRRRTFYDR